MGPPDKMSDDLTEIPARPWMSLHLRALFEPKTFVFRLDLQELRYFGL